MQNIILTTHAKERFTERWKGRDDISQVANSAWKDGKPLSRNLTKTCTLMGYHKDGYWTATYKVLKSMVFVFQKEGETITLTTLLPLKYLLQQRSRMISRARSRGKIS